MATSESMTPKQSHHRLLENVFSLYLLQGLNYLIPLAVLPYLVRVLGMERYGLLAFAQSFASYFTLLTDYGFNFSATRSIAQQQQDDEAISRIFCSVLLIKLALTIVGLAILAAIVLVVPRFHQSAPYFFVAFLAVIGNVLFPLWYFQGMERMRYISGIVGLAKAIGAASLFIFVHGPDDALLALAVQSLALVLGGVAGLATVFWRFYVRFRWPAVADLKAVLQEGLHLFISTAAISLYTNTNLFLVGLLSGNLQAGYFSAAEKLIRAAQGVLTPISQALFPRMSALAAQSRELALSFALRVLRWIGSLSFLGSLLIFVLAAPITVLCFGKAASESIPVVRWIAFLPFIIAVSNIFAVQLMIPFGLDKQLSRIVIFAGLLNLALAITLIRIFAAQGAGISVLVAELFVTVATGVVALRGRGPMPSA